MDLLWYELVIVAAMGSMFLGGFVYLASNDQGKYKHILPLCICLWWFIIPLFVSIIAGLIIIAPIVLTILIIVGIGIKIANRIDDWLVHRRYDKAKRAERKLIIDDDLQF